MLITFGIMALQKGDKLNNGKYTIEETLKVGRFCITYLATVNSSVPKVVIKTPKDEMYEYVQDIERCNNNLLAEASALSSCKHPHIVKFKKHFTEGEKVYLVMEHIAGDNLANLLETLPDKIMPEPQALTYIKQIGEALTAVHKSELVHRDVKPDNIILRAGKEEAILIGFGLARGLEDILTTVNLTIYDNLDPTIYAFFAPELYGPTTNRGPYTDVYSLAATLYFLL
ncbi:MAG: serine/threonine protein kinase, partial [Okeania sp. SIO2H7]|nr:serine/threonine protein kinase [Okeania sp. SIO2H7]